MDEKQNEVAVSVNFDTTPVLYTDNIFISTNEDGVVLNICQNFPMGNQTKIVSRIGMSRTHAKKFINEFSKLLALTEDAGHSEKKGK